MKKTCSYSTKVEVCFYGDQIQNLNVSFHPCVVRWKPKGGQWKREHARTGAGFVLNNNTTGVVKVINTPSSFVLPETEDEILKAAKLNPMVVKLGLAVQEALKLTVNTPMPTVPPPTV
jgi:hypothetical protein